MERRRFHRRRLLAALLAGALGAPLSAPVGAHTPYRQWKVLRQRFLLVHSSRSDPVSDDIAEKLVDILERVLPEAKAMVARAPDERRIASLLTTGQAVLAVMRGDRAADLYRHGGEFSGFEGEKIRALVAIGNHLLVSVTAFPRHHAWLVTAALTENPGEFLIAVPQPAADDAGVPVHPGALAYINGESLESQR